MSEYLIYMVIMAGVTYLIRMLPITICQKEIKSRFIKSFLFYMPYAVLGAMTFPAIFLATGDALTSSVGAIAGLFFAYKERSLIEVALCSCAFGYIAYLICQYFGYIIS